MDREIEGIFNCLSKRNIKGVYCAGRQAAAAKLLEIIPADKSVGISGSRTLDETGIVERLLKRGNKVFNQYEKGLSRQESLKVRNQGACADVFLSSANAITKDGRMVFFSALGHRIAGICNAENTVIVCGINKIVENIEEGIGRARNYVTPKNCQRLNFNSACLTGGICRDEICLLPEYKRMCCQILIIESEINPDRLKVVLVGEPLGI